MGRFQEVLARHVEGGRLRAAFEETGRRCGRHYDRTTLTRWLKGARPHDEEFVVVLADILKDHDVISSWEADGTESEGDTRNIMTRFRGLTPERRLVSFRQLTKDLLLHERQTRRKLSMRIELRTDLTVTCHRLDVGLAWTGYLPPRATVRIAPDESLLTEAYEIEQCVFRELIPLDSETFGSAYRTLNDATPVLRYKISGARDFRVMDATPSDADVPGNYEFTNDEMALAEIRLNVCFPYPTDLSMYAVKFGAYAVIGPTVVTMAVEGSHPYMPHAIPYVWNNSVSWHPGDFGRHELTLEIGDEESVIAPGSGIVFFWQTGPSH